MISEEYPNIKTACDLASEPRFKSGDNNQIAEGLKQFDDKWHIAKILNNGKECSFYTLRYACDYRVYFKDFDEAREAQKEELEKCKCKISIVPENKEYNLVPPALIKTQNIYKGIFDSCIDGKPNWEEFARRFNECYVQNYKWAEILPSDNNPFKPILFQTPNCQTLEDVVETSAFCFYISNGMSFVFSYIRKCENSECAKYFLPKNPKASFCTEKCRGRHRYLLKMNKI